MDINIPAWPAIVASALGAIALILSAWLTKKLEDRTKRIFNEKEARKQLYSEFVRESSEAYIDALLHDQVKVPSLVKLYGMISTMRISSSPAVVESAEKAVDVIVDAYACPNRDFSELRELVISRLLADPLLSFSEVCRHELESLR